MNLTDIAKRTLPVPLRDFVGVYGIRAISSSKVLMSLFSRIADGRPLDVETMPGRLCFRKVYGRGIICPRDGFRVFHEIFDSKPYEKYGGPENGDVVLDLGAYVGMFSYRAHHLVGDDGFVVAVEPEKSNYRILETNLSGINGIATVNKAAGSRNGEASLDVSPKSTCHKVSETGNVAVQMTTVDNLVHQLGITHVDFIKIDVEGAEIDALNGAVRTLRDNDVRLAIETYHDPSSAEDIAVLLSALGYDSIIEEEYMYARKR